MLREGGHAGGGQDRHPHRRQAELASVVTAAGVPRTSCCVWPRPSSGAASIRWPPPSSPEREARGLTIPAADGLPIDHRQGRDRDGRRSHAWPSATAALMEDSRRRRSATLGERAEALRAKGQTVMFVAVDGGAAGLLGVADPDQGDHAGGPRGMLHEEGMRIVMLTGDSRTTAEAVARELGIDEVEAEVLPTEKAEVVKRLQAEGPHGGHGGRRHQRRPRPGPGPGRHRHGHRHRRRHGERRRHAGQGRPARHRPRAPPEPRATMRNIRQNLFFAFVYNALGVPIAAGVLYPVLRPAAVSP